MVWWVVVAFATPPGCEATTEAPNHWPAPLPVENWMTDAAKSEMQHAHTHSEEAWQKALEEGERLQCGPVRVLRYDYGMGFAVVAETPEVYLFAEYQSPREGRLDLDTAVPLTVRQGQVELDLEPEGANVRLLWDRPRATARWSCSSGDTHSTCPWDGALAGELTSEGMPKGVWRWAMYEGRISVQATFEDGVANGPARFTGVGGYSIEGNVKKGQRDGEWLTKNPAKPPKVEHYKDGKPVE